MSTFTQDGRPLVLETPLGKDILLLASLHGVEGMSRPFHFTLEMLNEPAKAVTFSKLLGQPVTATLSISGAPVRHINGVVTRLVQGGQVHAADGKTVLNRYRAEVAPKFGLLRKRIQNRIFQQMTVPAILAEVLGGLDVRFAIASQYSPRDYCVQYRESDFAFASRLMEEEGIAYFFEHTATGHTMVVTDVPTTFASLPEQSRLIYTTVENTPATDRRVHDWEKQQDVVSGQYSARDHAFELQDHDLEYQQTLSGDVTVGTVSHALAVGPAKDLTIADYPGRYAQRFDGVSADGQAQADALEKVFDDGPRTVRIRMEEEAADSLKIRGAGDYSHLTPGYTFTLERHFDGNGDYLLTEVEHTVSIGDSYLTGEGASVVYSNRFECIPKGLTYRPQRVTPQPCISGPQSATVVGPSGQQIYCDKYGRVKVQFRWDRQGQHNSKSSCWLRVSQPWAGKGFGSFHLPRVGQEVVVAFEEGDPDRPIIIGSVYNSTDAPPFPLPEKAAQTGIKSSTINGEAANFSGLGFDDTPGFEHVQLHSERHQTQSAEANLFVNVGQEHHVSIGEVHSRQVGGLPLVNTFLSNAGPSGESGSGSGGGKSQSSTSGPTSDFNWSFSVVGGKTGEFLAKDTTLTFGWQMSNLIGVGTGTVLGQSVYNYWNPAGFLGEYVKKIPLLGKALSSPGGGETMLGAYADVYLGGSSNITYGSVASIHRGASLEATGDLTSGSFPKLAKAFAGCYIVMEVLDALLPALVPATVPRVERIAEDTAAYAFTQLFLSVWAMIELDENKITVLKPLADYATTYDALTVTFPYLLDDTGVPRAIDIYAELSGYLKPAGVSRLLSLATQLTGTGAGGSPSLPGISAETADGLKCMTAASAYCIAAPAICLFGRSETGSDASIVVQTDALGCMSLLSGTATTIASGANALISLKSGGAGGTMTLDCGGVGSLTLQSGPDVKTNTLTMTEEGVSLESLLQIELAAGLFAAIVNSDEGIVLGLRGDTGPTITIGEAGIELKFGASSIALTATGITLSGANVTHSADTCYTIKAPAAEVKEG